MAMAVTIGIQQFANDILALLGVNPVYVIIAAGLGGFLYGKFIKPTEWDTSPSPSEGGESLTGYNFTREIANESSEGR